LSYERAHLEMERRHLVEAEARVARQRELVGELIDLGRPTDLARQLLASLVETTRQRRVHRDYLEQRAREG